MAPCQVSSHCIWCFIPPGTPGNHCRACTSELPQLRGQGAGLLTRAHPVLLGFGEGLSGSSIPAGPAAGVRSESWPSAQAASNQCSWTGSD